MWSLDDISVGTGRVVGGRVLLFNVGFTGRIYLIRHVMPAKITTGSGQNFIGNSTLNVPLAIYERR